MKKTILVTTGLSFLALGLIIIIAFPVKKSLVFCFKKTHLEHEDKIAKLVATGINQKEYVRMNNELVDNLESCKGKAAKETKRPYFIADKLYNYGVKDLGIKKL